LLQRDAERDRRQAEWNALHYEILQRLAIEVSRVSIEAQSQSMRVESLGAKVDFNDRRVRTMEGTQTRPARQQESSPAPLQTAATGAVMAEAAPQPQPQPQQSEGQPAGDAPRRRRRRRRGRRSPGAGAPAEGGANTNAPTSAAVDVEEGDADGDEGFEEEAAAPEPIALDHRLPATTEHREDAAPAPEPIRTEEPPHTPEE